MPYTVRWEMRGKVHLCETEDAQTANQIQSAITAFWSGDNISVQIWEGLDLLREEIS